MVVAKFTDLGPYGDMRMIELESPELALPDFFLLHDQVYSICPCQVAESGNKNLPAQFLFKSSHQGLIPGCGTLEADFFPDHPFHSYLLQVIIPHGKEYGSQ